MLTADASVLKTTYFRNQGYIKGAAENAPIRRDARPLSMETPTTRW